MLSSGRSSAVLPFARGSSMQSWRLVESTITTPMESLSTRNGENFRTIGFDCVRSSQGFIVPRVAGTLVFGICALITIAASLAWYHSARFEMELAQRVLENLQAEGFEVQEVRVRGREVALLGEVDAHVDRGRIIEIASSVDGVRAVRDERKVVNYVDGRHFELHSYAGITTVEGELPEQGDVALVVDAIRNHFGVDPLGANLEIRRAVRRPPFLDHLAAILDITAAVSPLTIEYVQDSLRIAGDVSDADTRDLVTQRLERLLDDDIELRIQLRLPSMTREPDLRIDYRNGEVTVSGSVPDREFIEQLVAALALAFSVEDVSNDLRVDPDVLYSDWLEGVLRIVFPLAMTDWLEVEISDGQATLRGTVRREEELGILREQVRDNFDYPIRVVNLIR